jgi:hypothetical protein
MTGIASLTKIWTIWDRIEDLEAESSPGKSAA